MLLRSLAIALYRDKTGRRVYDPAVSNEDKGTGYICVARPKRKHPDIRSITNLYKIGYSTSRPAKRIKKASKELTYLMADVDVVLIFKCFNLNVHKLEHLLHTFFVRACPDIEMVDAQGNFYKPKEWFVVPLRVIKEAIDLVIEGKITSHRYDYRSGEILIK